MSTNPFAPRSVYARYNPGFAAQYGAAPSLPSGPAFDPTAGSAPVAGPSGLSGPVASGSRGYVPPVDDGTPGMTMQAGSITIDTSLSTQNSIYTPRNAAAAARPAQMAKDNPQYRHIARTTVIRKGGGETWEDPTLLDWDPSHFRLFVGNLGNDVSDEGLTKAFNAWPSFVRAKVIRDKFTTKSKGFGFVAYSDPEDFMKAWKALEGQYVGSRPVKLSKATTKVGAVDIGERKAKALDDNLKNKRGVGRQRGKPGQGAPGAGAGRKPYVRR